MPDAAALREALARGCLVLGRVRKKQLLPIAREGGFNTRIHLDRVEGLASAPRLAGAHLDLLAAAG